MSSSPAQQGEARPVGRPGRNTYAARIQSIEPLAATVLGCRLDVSAPIAYQPGQYCMVAVGDTARAFSFVTPAEGPAIEWLINTAPGGPASRFFRSATAGDDVSFTAPYGDFLLDPADTRPLLYLAGGVGLAPILAHILSLAPEAPARPVVLFVGHRSADDMFWDQKLTELAATRGFSYQGIVGPLIPHLNTIAVSEYTVYLCGSAAMCTATAEALYKLGASPANVHYELFT